MALKGVAFGVRDKYGRECGCMYEIRNVDERGHHVSFQATRAGRDYQALKSSDFFDSDQAAAAYAEKMGENYRKRCTKQFGAKAT